MNCAIKQTPWHSWKTGSLCDGCKLCVEGRKLVLFITGLCPQRCFYCPVSEQKFGKDVVFANEWQVKDSQNPQEIIEEALLTNARGAGITGGDPLAFVDRCCAYIQLLKQRFGKDFHIHLYTPLKLVTKERLQKLFDAGLDEIRFHPDLDHDLLWPRLTLAREFSWKVGIEIPAIPDYEEKTKKLIDFAAGKIDFLNMNELELSDTQAKHYELHARGYKPKDSASYGVAGSKEMALQMLSYAENKGIPAHFCTAKLKDGIQMKNRLQLRAKNIALPFDKVTKEGTLIRACAYLPELKPTFGYREKLQHADRNALIFLLTSIREKLIHEGIKGSDIAIDRNKLRLLFPQAMLKSKAAILKKQGVVPAVVEEYPTVDAIEIDVVFL